MSVISDERGAVMVLMAAALFPMVALLAFVVDVSHWFDYSRNLQNRADAAALAGAQELAACLGATPGDTTTGAQSAVGKWAQLYSGAGVNESVGNLPYSDAQVQAATGYKISSYGYVNNTTSFSAADPTSVDSPLTLRKGNLADFYVVLNGSNYHEHGGASFTMAAPGTPATFCASDPQYDQTEVGTPGPAGAMIDVKLSQQNLPLFFPLISGRPTLHAHARAFLEGEGSGPSVPIAVSDPGSTKCITAFFRRASDNSLAGTAVLHEDNPATLTWSSDPVSLPMDENTYVQAFLNDCGSPPSGQTYDDSSGILYVNTFGTGTPGSNAPPQIAAGGVTLDIGTCDAAATGDQYFSAGGCTVGVTAHVAFSADAKKKTKVTAVDIDNGGASLTLKDDAAGTTWAPSGGQTLSIVNNSGRHRIRIDWEQNDGTIGGVTCTSAASNPCKGTFGVQAQSFGACNGCDPPDDSGPIIVARVNSGLFTNVMSYRRNVAADVSLSMQLAGIRAAVPGAPPTVLRYGTNTNHQTGLVDCTPNGSDGSSASTAPLLIYGGCGPTNPFINAAPPTSLPPLNPLFVNTRGNCTTPAPPTWPSGNHQDCVQTTPGSKSNPIPCAVVLRITNQPVTASCTGGGSGAVACPDSNWPDILVHPALYKADRRKIPMLLVSPLDLSSADGAPQYWVQIKRFATFYVTGWDPSLNPGCNGVNENLASGSKQSKNSAIWGHWIDDVQPGTGDGNPCDLSSPSPTTCVPVLTR